MMKKNKRSNPSSSSSSSNNATMATDNDNPESPSSSSSHGPQHATTSSNAKRSAKGIFDQMDEAVNNNSASSDCGTPCSSPMIKDPYEFKIKTEDNDSDANEVVKKPRLENATQKINDAKNDESESSDQQQQQTPFNKQTSNTIMNSNSSKGMTHLNKKLAKERKKSVGINTNNEYQQPSPMNNYTADEKPCAPGTEIQLTGTVWLETTAGMLVINVTWRGRSYIGSLLDTSQHKFSPPTPNEFRPNGQPNNVNNCNSPAKGFRAKKRYNIPYRIPVGRNKKNGQLKSKLSNPVVKRSTNRNVSESSSSVDDASSVDENQDRLKCPIADCGLKFSSMSRMHEHLKEHSIEPKGDEHLGKNKSDDDNTLVHDDQTPTAKDETISPDKCLSVETGQGSVLPPRSSSVLPSMKTIDVGSEKDRWNRHETRTPSPPRLAKARSPSPLPSHQHHHQHPTSTPNLNRQNNNHSASSLTFNQHTPLPFQSSGNNGAIPHQPYQQHLSNHNPQNLPSSCANTDDPMRLFEKFKSHLSHSSSIGKKSPPKLMPEVNDMCHPFMSNKMHQKMPPSNPLNLLANNNNNNIGQKSPSENKSLNTLITESLMAAAAGKLNMNPHRSQSPLHQMIPPQSSSSDHKSSTSSSDLFAAVMSKMLAGVSATAGATTNQSPSSTNGMSNSLYNSHNQTLTKSSSMPTTVGNGNFNLNSLHQQQQQQHPNPSPNSHPLVNSQHFDTKSLSSAAYLMNLPGLLSSTTNHQMR